MTTILDDFSLEHPDNKNFGKTRRLKALSSRSSEFVEVEKLFSKGWQHPDKKKPKVSRIFKILASAQDLNGYHTYRAAVASSPSVKDRSKNPANEQLLFHGTNRYCSLGEDAGKSRLCHLSRCYLCRIIRSSFDISKCGSKHKFRRFGHGVYTTACSSKADDYSKNGEENSQFRAVLVSRVVVGNPHKRRFNATELTEPPCGHHSVLGEPGGDLNYEETVVYDNDAIRPAYLVIYGDAPAFKGNFKSLVVNLFKTPLAS
ncbi:hypothetical protein CPB83DRAFT_844835 [Crepidotus variabilis]|uniref:PARP catalytic domain-containing protein n=1 Tax=Crepidotus variabilis TaxID=179855 RepID=A0A9P6JVI8_9AGAR|nr:hypothetical protein CPB83DRAFT_844835 [Crepidotus variabilis]